MSIINIQFKHIPFQSQFKHNNIKYTKTNFNRGWYYKDGKKVFRNFKKWTLVKIEKEYFEV